jgi:hypothetical protein
MANIPRQAGCPNRRTRKPDPSNNSNPFISPCPTAPCTLPFSFSEACGFRNLCLALKISATCTQTLLSTSCPRVLSAVTLSMKPGHGSDTDANEIARNAKESRTESTPPTRSSYNGKRSLSLFSLCRYETLSLTTREYTPPPPILGCVVHLRNLFRLI